MHHCAHLQECKAVHYCIWFSALKVLARVLGRREAGRVLASSQHNLYVLLCVQCWTPDDGQRNCPKQVEFYSKNKYEKLVHLVGFIKRISENSLITGRFSVRVSFHLSRVRGRHFVVISTYEPTIYTVYDTYIYTLRSYCRPSFFTVSMYFPLASSFSTMFETYSWT